jgi:hypothetical protein
MRSENLANQSGSKLMISKLQDWKRTLIWLGIQAQGTVVNEYTLSSKALRYRLLQRTPRFCLEAWYGGTGNNIQQLLLALGHAKEFRGKLSINQMQLQEAGLGRLFQPIDVDFSPGKSENEQFTSKFFHFTEHTFSRKSTQRMHFLQGTIPRRECLVSRRWTERNLHLLATNLLRHHLTPPAALSPEDDQIVIWIRSGELANLNYTYYITNPLYFYKILAGRYRHALIITQASADHILLDAITSLFDSVSIERLGFDDAHRDQGFEIMRQAKNLATSGVSTFPLAAALLSDNLENFHCSDAFMVEHLNPLLLDPHRVKRHIVALPGYHSQWLNSTDRQALLYSYAP